MCEELKKSYNMDICRSYLQKKFPNIRKIVILKIRPYMKEALSEAKYNGFVGMALDCNDISNFPEIIETTKNMFGWVIHHIDLEKKVNKGYIPYRFHYINGEFICTNDMKVSEETIINSVRQLMDNNDVQL